MLTKKMAMKSKTVSLQRGLRNKFSCTSKQVENLDTRRVSHVVMTNKMSGAKMFLELDCKIKYLDQKVYGTGKIDWKKCKNETKGSCRFTEMEMLP